MVTEETLLIIRRNDFLAQLRKEEYDTLQIEHNFIVSGKSEYIYFDTQWCNKRYFIKEGYVKIGKVDDEGNEVVIDILQRGDVFGQFVLEQNNKPNGEFAQAYKTNTTLCAFTVENFKELLNNRSDLSVQYSKKIGQKTKKFENRIINLLQKNVRDRLLYFLWTLVESNYTATENSIVFDNFLTHKDIAQMTGTSRQTVTTILNQLSSEGILDINHKTISIHNIELLRKEIKHY